MRSKNEGWRRVKTTSGCRTCTCVAKTAGTQETGEGIKVNKSRIQVARKIRGERGEKVVVWLSKNQRRNIIGLNCASKWKGTVGPREKSTLEVESRPAAKPPRRRGNTGEKTLRKRGGEDKRG